MTTTQAMLKSDNQLILPNGDVAVVLNTRTMFGKKWAKVSTGEYQTMELVEKLEGIKK